MTDDLQRRLEAARNAPPMTEEQIAAQRASWVRGMTTPCKHGWLDFEQCPDCRKETPDD